MLRNNTSITVVIPVYGRYDLLVETLKSVYNQKGNFLIKTIVIDDNYPQPPKNIINKLFPQAHMIRNKENFYL